MARLSAQWIRSHEIANQQSIKMRAPPSQLQLPTLIRKALMDGGVDEEEHSAFLSWAFDGQLPVTFTEFSARWNERFGNKMWLSLTEFPKQKAYEQLWNIFSAMGKLFCESKRNLKAKTVHALGVKTVVSKTLVQEGGSYGSNVRSGRSPKYHRS